MDSTTTSRRTFLRFALSAPLIGSALAACGTSGPSQAGGGGGRGGRNEDYARALKVQDLDIPNDVAARRARARMQLLRAHSVHRHAHEQQLRARPVHRPARKVTVVDTTGAGDSFTGALLNSLIRQGQHSPAALAGCTAPDLTTAPIRCDVLGYSVALTVPDAEERHLVTCLLSHFPVAEGSPPAESAESMPRSTPHAYGLPSRPRWPGHRRGSGRAR